MFIKNFKDYIDNLNEGLIKTYDGNYTIENTLDDLKLLGFNVSGYFKDDMIHLKVFNFSTIDSSQINNFFDLLAAKLTNQFAWFPATVEIVLLNNMSNKINYNEDYLLQNHKNILNIEITYDSKFDDEELNVPSKLYHLSIKEYKNKINKYGLYPKSKSKKSSHIDRIYLCKNISDCRLLIPQMKIIYNQEKITNHVNLKNLKWNKNIEYVIYEIDNSDKNIKIFKDPRYKDLGYYTLDNISPNKLKVIEEE